MSTTIIPYSPLRKLPIGIQSFEKLRSEGFLFVDKTALAYRLKKGKKITTSDERYLHMAEDNLFGELAIPFEMTKGEAEAYFISKVSMV